MKKLIIAALACVALASCQKENDVKPVQPQTVTYTVNCKHCLVYVEDNVYNAGNANDNAKTQYFVVNGNFKYSFDNDTLSRVNMKVVVSVFTPPTRVSAEIKTSDGKSARLDELMGYSMDIDNGDEEISLNLK